VKGQKTVESDNLTPRVKKMTAAKKNDNIAAAGKK
jgi:hypothetical protein